VAKVAAAIVAERIELAGEPAYGEVSWVSAYRLDPFGVSVTGKVALLADWSVRLLAEERTNPRHQGLVIHDPIGHATELGRALVYEAAHAGPRSRRQLSSAACSTALPVMHVTGDQTAESFSLGALIIGAAAGEGGLAAWNRPACSTADPSVGTQWGQPGG
jgi:TldD protein